jgi:perosamine synthetase
MHIGRTLPPASAPLALKTIYLGLKGLMDQQAAIDRFKRSICRHFHVRHCFLVSSGAAALTIVLRAARKLQPSRDLVLIPGYTCYSVPAAIKRAGLDICPCDIDPDTLDFDRTSLSAAVRVHKERLLAVVPTHLFGMPADVAAIRRIIGQDAVCLVEDAAQAMGSKGPQGFLGCSGDAGFFSLGRGKAFSTMGGGIIVTNQKPLADEIERQIERCPQPGLFKILRCMAVSLFVVCFSRPTLFWLPRSMPFLHLGETVYDPAFEILKWSAFQAGLAVDWEERLTAAQFDRKVNAEFWLRTLCGPAPLKRLKMPAGRTNFIRYPLYIRNGNVRRALLSMSDRFGLGLMGGYPEPVTHIPQLHRELSGFDTPNARKVAKMLVTLPTHSWLTPADRHRIAEVVFKALSHGCPESINPSSMTISPPSSGGRETQGAEHHVICG